MATLSVVIAQTYNPKRGYRDPVPAATPFAAEKITTSGTSQKSTIGSTGVYGAFGSYWILTASGGDMWVKFGTDPTAAAGSQWLILDGQTREFAVDADAQKVAVIDA
ncbi:MAG: hypothetical protein WA975_03480 [Mesorhizobium sp.]